MIKKLFILLLIFSPFFASAQSITYTRNLFPEVTNTYELGTSTKQWFRFFTTNASTTVLTSTVICLTGDICRTTWPTGTLLTFTYPLVNTANTISLAFGTTTSNVFSALQTFNAGATSTNINSNSATIGTLTVGSCTGCASSGVTAVTGTYPIISSGGATPAISIAFGTTTANSWSLGQTFLASTTLQNFTAVNSTTTNATTTKFAITGLSGSGNLIVIARNDGDLSSIGLPLTQANGGTGIGSAGFPVQAILVGNGSSALLATSSAPLYVGNIFATTTNASTLTGGFSALASSTLQNFTASNATTTQATTTSLYVSGTATSTTINNGINILSGCFAINGACVNSSSGGGTVYVQNYSSTSQQALGSTTIYFNGTAGYPDVTSYKHIHVEVDSVNNVIGTTADQPIIAFNGEEAGGKVSCNLATMPGTSFGTCTLAHQKVILTQGAGAIIHITLDFDNVAGVPKIVNYQGNRFSTSSPSFTETVFGPILYANTTQQATSTNLTFYNTDSTADQWPSGTVVKIIAY